MMEDSEVHSQKYPNFKKKVMIDTQVSANYEISDDLDEDYEDLEQVVNDYKKTHAYKSIQHDEDTQKYVKNDWIICFKIFCI